MPRVNVPSCVPYREFERHRGEHSFQQREPADSAAVHLGVPAGTPGAVDAVAVRVLGSEPADLPAVQAPAAAVQAPAGTVLAAAVAVDGTLVAVAGVHLQKSRRELVTENQVCCHRNEIVNF